MKLKFSQTGVEVIQDMGSAKLTREQMVDAIRTQGLCPEGTFFPDGIVGLWYNRPQLVVLHEQPPRRFECRWIAPDSPKNYGQGTKYKQREFSWPWIYSLIHMSRNSKGGYNFNNMEAYARRSKLSALNQKIQAAPMLNNSVIANGNQSWVCTQYLGTKAGQTWQEIAVRALEHMWYGGFNYSSEAHEGASWYGKSLAQWPQLEANNWEKWSAARPELILSFDWIKLGPSYQDRVNQLVGATPPVEKILANYAMEKGLFKVNG